MSDGSDLPDLPTGWTWTVLSEITIPIPNMRPEEAPSREFVYADISSVSNESFRVTEPKRFVGKDAPSRARRPVQRFDTLFSNVRTYLRNVAILTETDDVDVCSTGFTVLRPNKAVEPHFLFRYTLTDAFIDRVTPEQTGTHYPATSDRVVIGQPIPLPPLAEQRRIVAKVETLLARVQAVRQRLARVPLILKRFRQAVLTAACNGELTADWREMATLHETGRQLLERVSESRQAIASTNTGRGKYTKPGNAAGMDEGELPASWCWVRWEEIGFCQNGSAFPSKLYADAGVPLLRPGNLHASGTVVWNDKNTRYLPETFLDTKSDFVVGPSELVMNLTAQSLRDEFLGRVCLTADGEKCLLNQRIARLTPVIVPPVYCLLVFKSPLFRQFVYGLNTGSLIQHMFTTQIYDFCLPLPPLAEQHEIVRRVDALFKLADGIEHRVAAGRARAERLTQAILAKAFHGELVPTEAELARAEGRDYETAEQLLARVAAEPSQHGRIGAACKTRQGAARRK